MDESHGRMKFTSHPQVVERCGSVLCHLDGLGLVWLPLGGQNDLIKGVKAGRGIGIGETREASRDGRQIEVVTGWVGFVGIDGSGNALGPCAVLDDGSGREG